MTGKEKGHVETKGKKINYFPTASDVQPLLWEQSLNTHNSFLGRNMFS